MSWRLLPAPLVLLALGFVALPADARWEHAHSLDVRVWQSADDPESLALSLRLEGGRWGHLGTVSLDLSRHSDSRHSVRRNRLPRRRGAGLAGHLRS